MVYYTLSRKQGLMTAKTYFSVVTILRYICYEMLQFITYTLRWISSNLAIPFWTVGHIHLSINIYEDLVEILSSIGMNLIVAIGFYMEWREHKKNSCP